MSQNTQWRRCGHWADIDHLSTIMLVDLVASHIRIQFSNNRTYSEALKFVYDCSWQINERRGNEWLLYLPHALKASPLNISACQPPFTVVSSGPTLFGSHFSDIKLSAWILLAPNVMRNVATIIKVALASWARGNMLQLVNPTAMEFWLSVLTDFLDRRWCIFVEFYLVRSIPTGFTIIYLVS